ncbi:sulfotransferase family 2 domain-containing protein [Fictibacillus iocasae]|uniref:Sulfotransferase family 2 domain-containing protein n=1 Tax=Fictibacillus iocasae TaxID=2715437 RepID=A0ABW2NWU4_9BACL
MNKDKVLVLVHIPKTAGSSLTTAIMPYYQPHEVFTENDNGSFPSPGTKIIIGHNRFGRYHGLGPLLYITMLRNPIDRVISHYYYLKHVVLEDNLAKHVSLEEFSRSIWAANLQTQYLTGGVIDFELAIQHLKTFAFFGITELFTESLYLLEDNLGFANIQYSRINENPQKPKKEFINPYTIEQIRRNNLSDMKLYHWARNTFDKRLKESDWFKN